MEHKEGQSKQLREAIEETHNLNELRGLAYDLSINYEQLSEGPLTSKVVSLIDHVCRHGKIKALESKLRAERDFVDWGEIDWDAIGPSKPSDNLDETPPYQGLNHFDVSASDRYFGRDFGRYFGRDQLITDLINRINDEKLNFLMVVGASGMRQVITGAGRIFTL